MPRSRPAGSKSRRGGKHLGVTKHAVSYELSLCSVQDMLVAILYIIMINGLCDLV